LVGTLALALGIVLCVSVVLTRVLGYAPDDSFASLFAALWPTGLALAIFGGILWVAVWVLHGFLAPASPDSDPARRAHLNE
jgi:hypothetical protein